MKRLRRSARADRGGASPADAAPSEGAEAGATPGSAEPGGAAEAPEDDGAAEAPEDDGSDAPSSRRRWLFPAVSGALIAVLAVLTGLLAWQYADGPDAAGDASHGAQGNLSSPFIDAAETVVLGITNVDPGTVESNAEEVLAHTTGGFHDEYQAAQGQFASLVGEASATSHGRIVQSGLESVSGDTGTVLLVVSTEVRNNALAQPSQRGFRLRVTVEKDGDSYKVSNLEQVP